MVGHCRERSKRRRESTSDASKILQTSLTPACFVLTERLCLLLSSERHRGPVLREGTGRETWEQEVEDQQLSGSFSRSILTIVKEKETANRFVRRSSSLCVPFSPASTVRGTPKAVILESHWAQGQCRSVKRTTIISSILAVASQTPRSYPRISPDPPPNTLFKSSKGIARRKLGKLVLSL